MADGKKKSRLRELKERWYEKVPLNVRQLDIIIAIGIAGLVIVTVLIVLEATGVWKIG